MSINPRTPQYTTQEVGEAVSTRREKIASLKQQITDNPKLEKTLMARVSTLMTEIDYYQKHEVKDKE